MPTSSIHITTSTSQRSHRTRASHRWIATFIACATICPLLSCDGTSSNVPTLTIDANVSGLGYTLATCDVNGDGIDDLIASHSLAGDFPRASAGDVYMMLGPLYSTMQAEAADLTLHAQTPLKCAGNVLAHADFDNDGTQDIVAASLYTMQREDTSHSMDPTSSEIYVISGRLRGEKNLEDSAYLKIIAPPSTARAMVAGDVNNDGHDDLVLGCPLQATVFVIHGPRTGTLTLPDDADAILTGPSGSLGTSVGIVHRTDGSSQLAISDYVNHTIYVVPGQTIGTHAVNTIATATIRSSDATDLLGGITIGDVNADGNDDLLAVAGSTVNNAFATIFVIAGPLIGTIDARTDARLILTDVDHGDRRVDLAVSPAIGHQPGWISIGLAGKSYVPDSELTGQAWLIDGSLTGTIALTDANAETLGYRMQPSLTKLSRFGTDGAFGHFRSADTLDWMITSYGTVAASPLRGSAFVVPLP